MHDSFDLEGIWNEHLFALKLWGGSTTIGSKFLVTLFLRPFQFDSPMIFLSRSVVAKFPEFHPSSLPEYQPFGTV